MENGAEFSSSFVVVGFRTMTSAAPTGNVGGTMASSSVSLIVCVCVDRPLMTTTEPGPKFAPVTWIVWPRPTMAGVIPLITGSSAVTSILMALDGPPPGCGFSTVTGCTPSGTGGGTGAVSCVAETNVVV